MSAYQMAHMAELENQAFSLMGRLHVVLRRETGRITDVEYMRIDPAYCRHLIEVAQQSGNVDLEKIGDRLEAIYFGEDGLFVVAPPRPPLLARLGAGRTATPPATPAQAHARPAAPAFAGMPAAPATQAAGEVSEPPKPPESQHYVGRLR